MNKTLSFSLAKIAYIFTVSAIILFLSFLAYRFHLVSFRESSEFFLFTSLLASLFFIVWSEKIMMPLRKADSQTPIPIFVRVLIGLGFFFSLLSCYFLGEFSSTVWTAATENIPWHERPFNMDDRNMFFYLMMTITVFGFNLGSVMAKVENLALDGGLK